MSLRLLTRCVGRQTSWCRSCGKFHQVARLQTLSPMEWAKTAEHGEYRTYSVFIMFRHVALHDFLHAYRIEELLLRPDWPASTDAPAA